jgi:thiol-disulfide isomerase/thioredoxin/outer membrane lipoprotein-sorting protein
MVRMLAPEFGGFMRRQLSVFAVLTIIGAATVFAQTVASPTPSEGLELLKQVAQQYADAKSYYIESVEERTSSTNYSHHWDKTIVTAAQSPGDRFHYEGRSSSGTAMKVADGKTIWTYRADEHRYTAKPQAIGTASQQTVIGMTEIAMFQAENLRKYLGVLAKALKSADRLPDATLVVSGRKVYCHVARFQSSDRKRASPGYLFDKTIWIDKTHQTVIKMIEHNHNYLISGASRIPLEEETTTIFTRTELNGPVNESLFAFIPPSDAKLIQDFPDPRSDFGGVRMTGDQVPSLKLKSADSKVIALDSFRGKPVLLDFWATWCGPCVEALPQLAQIYSEAKDKGFVLLAVDQDEEANTATDFLAKKGYNWPDFHDGDGEIERLVGSYGIPRTMLIDAQGKVVYDATGMDEDALRIVIAKLGPDYAALTPKPKQVPCVASK